MRITRTTFRPDETYEQWRQRLLDETAHFIEWGLQHPDQVHAIPMHPIGQAHFSDRLKTLFWSLALRDQDGPD